MKFKTKQISVRDFLIKYALFILIVVLWFIYGMNSPHFFTIKNLRSLLTNAAPLLIYATGMTYILVLGEIDLSVGSVGAVAAAAWILSMTKLKLPLYAAFLIALLVGAVCGVLTGFMVVKLRINAFMASLGMQFILRGICYLSVNGEQILTPKEVHTFANYRLLTLSPLIYISLLIAVYGVRVFIKRNFLTYLFLRSEFVFLDYEEPKLKFFLDCLALMGLCVFAAHYGAKLVKRMGKT